MDADATRPYRYSTLLRQDRVALLSRHAVSCWTWVSAITKMCILGIKQEKQEHKMGQPVAVMALQERQDSSSLKTAQQPHKLLTHCWLC